MKKFLTFGFILLLLCFGFAGVTLAAPSLEEALGEVNIYNGGTEHSYLTVNGRLQTFYYTYFNYENHLGEKREIPAYCVNPNIRGVPKAVALGEYVKYLAEEKASDPKITGIVASGYPTRSLEALGLDTKEQAYYATKIALWCYIQPGWDIYSLEVNPALSPEEKEVAERVLEAAQGIYTTGTWWTKHYSPALSALPDREEPYPVTVDGKAYRQQIFTVTSDTWVVNYNVRIAFADSASVPAGTRIVNMDNEDISVMRIETNERPYQGRFKLLYPEDAVKGQSGSLQIDLAAEVYQYAVFYAVCQETDKYGQLQNYMCDTDPTRTYKASVVSSFQAQPGSGPEEPKTGLEIIKVEAGTGLPLAGAVFEVKTPEGDTLGTYGSDTQGRVRLSLKESGTYVVTEVTPPAYYLPAAEPTQTVTVRYGEVARLTFANAPYGDLRLEKLDAADGRGLPGARVQIRHIESGATYTGLTEAAGVCRFESLRPGAYEIRELAAPAGYNLDPQVYTVNVTAGTETGYTLKNAARPGLRILKYDRESLVAMPEVTFRIYRDTVLLGEYRTDELGEILLADLVPGTYRIEERDTGDISHIPALPQEIELMEGSGIQELVFFNDKKPGLELVKVDAADPSLGIPNAVFRIRSVDGSFGPEEFTTDARGGISLRDLPPGAYMIEELSCPGYEIYRAMRIIQLDPNEAGSFVFTNHRKPSLQIIKTDAENRPLPGVSFRIAGIGDGSHYLDRTTDTTGRILLEGLDPGIYSVRETAAAAGYILDSREHQVELFGGKTSTLTLQNLRQPSLTICKSDADTGEPVAGTVFAVRAADGHWVDEIRTDAAGRAVLENLLPGVYQVQEKSVPSPYLLEETPQLVTLYPNRKHTVYFENHRKPGLVVEKVDSVTGEPIQGAKFRVTTAAGSNGDLDEGSGGIRDFGTYYTDDQGRFALGDLTEGWYRVTEVEPAPGYGLKEPSFQEIYLPGGKSRTLVFENTPLSALVVYKYDTQTGQPVKGAVFQLRLLAGTSGSGGTIIGTYHTSMNGSFVVTGLKAGTYIVEEIASDNSHVIDTAPQTVYFSGQEQDTVRLFFGNSPKGGLLIRKIDSVTGKPLSDVEFLVTSSNGAVLGKENGRFVTDAAGSILLEGLEPGLTVVVKELRARPGYLLDDIPQTIQILSGQTVTLEFRNQPKGGLLILKKDAVTGEPLPGAEFTITTSDGTFVPDAEGQLSSNGIYTTDEAGQILLTSLTPGTYVVTERKAPAGYLLDSRPQTVAVNVNDTQMLTFINQPFGSLTILKTDGDTGRRLSGAEVEVRKLSGELLGHYLTDRNGLIHLPGLASGWYIVTELKAPAGYRLDATPQQVEVREGETASLTLTNRRASQILIHKIDADTKEGISGVSFLLSDPYHNPIGQYISDQNGYVHIEEELAEGRYYLQELTPADGYLADRQEKSIYLRRGSATEVRWENTAVKGQIQIIKKSADYNPVNGLTKGTPLAGAVFEIYDKAGNPVQRIQTDQRGRAVSKLLPLSRYTIREIQAPDYYSAGDEVLTAYLEHPGQILTFEITNKSIVTGVSIQKEGYGEIMPGQPIRYALGKIANTSNVPLDSFYWRDTLPAQVQLERIVTGTYSQRQSYKILYRTNLSDEHRVLADSLSTKENYSLDTRPATLGLAANERITEILFVFGRVQAGFGQVETPYLYGTAQEGLRNGESFVNVADAGGLSNRQWIMAVSRWLTTVYAPGEDTLPKTGY